MPQLSSIKQLHMGQKILVYGQPKTGKTYDVGQLAEAGFKPIWFDLERGAATLLNSLSPEAQARITLITVTDTKEVPRAAETVSQFWNRLIKNPKGEIKICVEHGRIDCPLCARDKLEFDILKPAEWDEKTVIVIDSLSQLSDSAMAVYTRDVAGYDLADKLGEYGKVEFKHFDAQGRLLGAIASAIQAASFHVVAITHEISVELEDGKELIVPKYGTKNLSKMVAKFFDHVVYRDKINGKHVSMSQTTDSNKILIGNRSNLSTKAGATLADLLHGKVQKISS